MKDKKRPKQQLIKNTRFSRPIGRFIFSKILIILIGSCSTAFCFAIYISLHIKAYITSTLADAGYLVSWGIFSAIATIVISYCIGLWRNQNNKFRAKSRGNRVIPPELGEFLFYLFLSRAERENLIGDLQEEYLEVHSKFGKPKANIWYYKQVFTSLYPLIRRFVIKWGLIGVIGKWVSKIIS